MVNKEMNKKKVPQNTIYQHQTVPEEVIQLFLALTPLTEPVSKMFYQEKPKL